MHDLTTGTTMKATRINSHASITTPKMIFFLRLKFLNLSVIFMIAILSL